MITVLIKPKWYSKQHVLCVCSCVCVCFLWKSYYFYHFYHFKLIILSFYHFHDQTNPLWKKTEHTILNSVTWNTLFSLLFSFSVMRSQKKIPLRGAKIGSCGPDYVRGGRSRVNYPINQLMKNILIDTKFRHVM